MSTRRAWVLLSSILAVGLGLPPTLGCSASILDPSDDDQSDAIIGGQVDNGDPSVGMLIMSEGFSSWICTASLIAPRLLLTAAHCVNNATANATVRAQFGTTEAGAQWQNASLWTWHPSFVPERFADGFDVAVVQLAQPQTRALLSFAHSAPQQSWVGQDVRVVGYGNDNGTAATGSGTKRHATMKFNSWTDRLIKVGQTGRTVCNGDSGGPTFKNVNGVDTVIGVSSFLARGCTGEGSMSRVDAYAAWIDEQVARLGGGCTIKGAIKAKYDAVNGASFLGACQAGELPTADGAGRYNHFANGSIFWHPNTGAWVVQGGIRARWESLNWERGNLGYPITDETGTGDGRGRYNHFQNGSIYWTPQTGAWEVRGGIRAKWEQLGWERSILKYPTTNEEATRCGGGRYNGFEGGAITWSPAAGAHETHGPVRDRWAALQFECSYLGFPTSDVYSVAGGGFRSDFEGGYIDVSASGVATDRRR